MMVPDDVGMTAFHGNAKLKETVLERLQEYEAQGDTSIKMAMLQEQRQRRAKSGIVFNPYPQIVRREDIAGLRISGDVSTLYALGEVTRSNLCLVGDEGDSRIYLVNYSDDETYHKKLGVPPTVKSLLHTISNSLAPERELPWLKQFWAAVPVGASLWQAPMRLVLWALSDPSHGILGLSNATVAPDNDVSIGIKAVHDSLALYRTWLAGGKAEPPEWFPFYTQAEGIVKNGWRQGDDGKPVHDLPASERCCLLAAACAAQAADVEETIVTPLPQGTIKIQIVGDNLRAPGKAISQAGLYAAERGIVPSIWYETCASVLLDILADCPVPDRADR